MQSNQDSRSEIIKVETMSTNNKVARSQATRAIFSSRPLEPGTFSRIGIVPSVQFKVVRSQIGVTMFFFNFRFIRYGTKAKATCSVYYGTIR